MDHDVNPLPAQSALAGPAAVLVKDRAQLVTSGRHERPGSLADGVTSLVQCRAVGRGGMRHPGRRISRHV